MLQSSLKKIQIEANPNYFCKMPATFSQYQKNIPGLCIIKHECCLHSIHHLGRGRDHIRRQAPYSFIVEIGPFINLPVAATHEDMNSLLAASDPYFICNVCSTPALINLQLRLNGLLQNKHALNLE